MAKDGAKVRARVRIELRVECNYIHKGVHELGVKVSRFEYFSFSVLVF